MSQLHLNCSMPHAEDVKGEFARLDMAIVSSGMPTRGVGYDHLFALWTSIFASPDVENRIDLYAFLTGRTAS